jgi:uncharacterized membrane protein YfcA
MSESSETALLLLSGIVAGGVNAVAGGGTILTFAVLSAILPPGPGRLVAANVTSKIGLWPGAAAAAWAYRGARGEQPRWARWLVVPSVAGGVLGVILLQWLPKESFDAVVPWLILLAAVLFAVQPQVARLTAARSPQADRAASAGRVAVTILLQLLVGIYGGYFGAGIGILMLASLGVLGLGDVHALNAVKTLLAAIINGVATGMLVVGAAAGGFEIAWWHVAVLAAGSVAGGLAVPPLARRLPQAVVRRLVSAIAFGLAGYHFWREWTG